MHLTGVGDDVSLQDLLVEQCSQVGKDNRRHSAHIDRRSSSEQMCRRLTSVNSMLGYLVVLLPIDQTSVILWWMKSMLFCVGQTSIILKRILLPLSFHIIISDHLPFNQILSYILLRRVIQ